ncbi:hypothetical protein LshimejAT787_0307160 [Lyophyllum shimeji]|uniref:Uncharacterized protein n=1 Tax=Lyophyllum shimeji TaxID=47721 RepID=A0A9P3UK91_LYOSH|nr:hypothetical protein LshimejAT787_0307160 [Lyophyllum shimeji]
MPILFSPALPDTVHVAVPADAFTSNDATAVLNFTATLPVTDHAELKRNGGRVQLWSNIPFDGPAGSTGDWLSYDLEEESPTVDGAGASTTEVLMGNARQDGAEAQEWSVLSLRVYVPLADRGQSRFAFTYRVVYGSGEIRWLGEFGRNGTLVVQQTDPTFLLADDWLPGEGGLVCTAAGEAAQTESVVIRLVNPSDYTVWTVDGNSTGKSPLAFFVPLLRPSSVYIPPTYILHCSSDATVSVPSDGIISTSGPGSLSLRSLPSRQPELRTFANDIVARCSTEHVQVATLGEDAGHLIVATKASYPLQGFIVPTMPRPAKPGDARVVVSLDTLRMLLPSRLTPFTLFSPQNCNIYFFTGSLETVTITVDAIGSPFILSPVASLKAGDWHVSILSHYHSAQPSENTLPTPPPSPQLRPIAHLTSAGVSPFDSGPSSLSGSVLSLQNAAQEVQKDEDAEDETIDRQLIVRPRPSLLARLRVFFYVVFFILAMALKLLSGRLDHLDNYDEADYSPDGLDDELEVSEAARFSDGESDDRTSTPMAPRVAIDAPVSGQGSKQEPTSLVAEISGGAVLIASRITSAGMDGTGGPVVVEMNGRHVDVKETRIGDGVSLLEFDGGGGGTVRISYLT